MISGRSDRGHDDWKRPQLRDPLRCRAVADQIAALARVSDRLDETVEVDQLTGLMNAAYFREGVREALGAAAEWKTPLSVLILDLDDFGRFNEAHGRACGDQMLRDVAGLLSSSIRGQDLIARLENDEFAILLPSAGSCAAWFVGDRIRSRVERHESPYLPLTACVGVATATLDDHDPDELIGKALQALGEAKRCGANRVFHREDLDSAVSCWNH